MNDASRIILVRYHEIALKGENRGWFEDRLAINVRRLLRRVHGKEVRVSAVRNRGRVLVRAPWDDRTRSALERTFGITNYSLARPVETNREAILAAAVEELQSALNSGPPPQTFRVSTRRSEKAFPENSVELDRWLGGELADRFPHLRVQLRGADVVVGLEIRHHESFLWSRKLPGPGGLPVGTNAPLLALLSGGIDSPVAAHACLKRGSPVGLLHFHGGPFVGDEVLQKIDDLAQVVNRYMPDPRPVHVVPFGKIQERIALATNPKLRTLIYRRLMFRIACRLAEPFGYQGLVTGESLGQVASQTVENLSVVNAAANLPVIRPLITLDKDEIIAKARALGTYEISIRPGLDCCTLFADRHPTIRADLSIVETEEAKLPMQELIEQAVAQVQVRSRRSTRLLLTGLPVE